MFEEKSGSRAPHSIAVPDASKQVNPAGNFKDLPASGPPARKLDGGRAEAQGSLVDLRNTTVGPKLAPERSSVAPLENTELERRVLAHERILQALIAHMAETEPKFLARLSDTFCVPMQMSRSEHDYTDTDSYAAEFIGAVVRLGVEAASKPPEAVPVRKSQIGARSTDAGDARLLFPLPRIQVRQAGGVWRVTKDGHFHGDFLKEQDALAAVEAAGRSVAQTP